MSLSRPAHHANASRTLFQNPWKTPNEIDDNAVGPPESPSSSAQDTSGLQARNNGNGTWFNSWTSGFAIPSLSTLLSNIPLEWAQDLSSHGISPTKVVKPDFEKFEKNKGTVKAIWLGHASFLVELPHQKGADKPIRVLFDPMFSDRAGPSAWTGIRRRLPPPCTISELPEFQFVCISHNHYDHLDLPSITEIARTRGEDVVFLVPLGVKSLLVSIGIESGRVHELDWWDEITLSRPRPEIGSRDSSDSGSSPASKSVKSFPPVTFVCVPAQHTSGRNVLDRWATLWCGWVVKQESEGSRAQVYHAGDTGYIGTNGPCPVFKEIGERCGPIDLAMLPIWRGGTLSFISQFGLRLTHHPLLSSLHASPSDAVLMHRDLRSRHSLAMHFATFAGSETEALEPLVELKRAREETGLGEWWEEGGIGSVDVGECVEVTVTG